jgi:DNA processing protein
VNNVNPARDSAHGQGGAPQSAARKSRDLADSSAMPAVATTVLEPGAEDRVGVSVNELTAIYVLEQIQGFGPQKYKELHTAGVTPRDVVQDPARLPQTGKRGDSFKTDLRKLVAEGDDKARTRAARQIGTADRLNAHLLTYNHPSYPRNVYGSNNPVPVLYVRGSLDVLGSNKVVACVGSRGIREPYRGLEAEFARRAVDCGFTIVSGFALGADTVGHETAWRSSGATVAVMPSGLDRVFPPENRPLWDALLTYPAAALVSEFPFGIAAASLTLRKRNKLIVAFALGVLIAQSAIDGGAMNAYRFAVEQKKPIASFEPDGTKETSGNEQVGKTSEVRGTLFSQNGPDHVAYERWLHALSSLT